jgi:hypothetical protein
MTQKILYCLEQYFLLGLLLISILGWGRVVITRLLSGCATIPKSGLLVLQATTGLGLVTLLIMIIAAFGALTAPPLLAILIVGILLFIPGLVTGIGKLRPGLDVIKIGQLRLAPSILIYIAAAAFLSNALVRPLQLPQGWDEVAYHLPTALAWAESGQLVVTDWLRYPLFPFNMQLLYAAALILASDITAHLVHALTGLLAVVLTFSVARLYIPTVFATLSSVFLVYAIRDSLHTADVDLGLMLYIFSAFASLAFSYIEKQKRFILLSAFFIGLALGTKYQAMFFLPALAIGFLLVERNWKTLALAVLIASATGLFWYVRNFLVSGDPIHPIGGSVFGYWQWNAEDVRRQFMDFENRRSLPPWYLLPSVGSLLFWRSSVPVVKACMVVSVVVVVLWFIFSGYARYLLPIYPMLALLSSYFLHRLFGFFRGYQIVAKYWARLHEKAQLAAFVILLLVIILDWGKSTRKDISELVLPDSMEQIALLRAVYPGFELLHSLDQPLSGMVYQLGFEDEIYYLGTPVLGDHFGKGRYPDVLRHLGNSADLSSHLHSLGASYLLVNLVRNTPDNAMATAAPEFSAYFETVSATPRAVLYRLTEADHASRTRVMPFSGDKAPPK